MASEAALLPYRFGPRPGSARVISRKRLLRRITEASLLKQLVIVRGPAGSGKTTLLAQWLDLAKAVGRPVAWLTLDDADADVASFVSGLAGALDHAGCPRSAERFRTLEQSLATEPVSALARRLSAASNASGETPVIILDRLDVANGADVGRLLDGLIHHATTLRFIIATRARPSISIGALRARDQLEEFGPEDLHLTAMEINEAFGPDIPELYARRLHLETSGEPIAVGLACLSLDAGMNTEGRLSWQERLFEFYREEVLDALPDEARAIIARVAMVERFDLSLAEAIAGPNAIGVIDWLYYRQALLSYHRATREYQLPEMLRRFLEGSLARFDTLGRQDLHARAAKWFQARNRWGESLRHSTESGDRAMTRQLLKRIADDELVSSYGVTTTRTMLAAAGDDNGALEPGTLLSMALVCAHEGNFDAAVSLVEEARQRGIDDRDVARSGKLTVVEGTISAFLDKPEDERNHPSIERYLASAEADDHQGRALGNIILSTGCFAAGDMEQAGRLVDQAAFEYDQTEGVYGAIFAHIHRILARFWLNDVDGSVAESALADKMANIFFPEDQRLTALCAALRFGTLFETGRKDLDLDVTELVGVVGTLESWIEIQLWTHELGIRAAMARHRFDEAQAIQGHGVEVADRLGFPRLAWNMRLASVNLAVHAGDMARGWSEARRLHLTDGGFLNANATRLTWRERMGGLLTLIRLLDDREEFTEAERACSMLERELTGKSVKRNAAALAIARARICHRRQDTRGAERWLRHARTLCPGKLPLRLFLDAGDCLKPYLFALGAWSEPEAYNGEATEMPKPPLGSDPLTARERQILLCMSEGHPNKVAAHQLGLSEATVKFHLRNIYRKLRAQNRTQAIARYRSLAAGH